MKKLIASVIVAVATLVPAVSQAQSYSQLVAKQRMCANVGSGWSEVWEHGTLGGKTVGRMSQDLEEGKLDKESFMALYMLHLRASVQKPKFSSSHDAYMAGLADCMDGR